MGVEAHDDEGRVVAVVRGPGSGGATAAAAAAAVSGKETEAATTAAAPLRRGNVLMSASLTNFDALS
jgi:hypothetical protein